MHDAHSDKNKVEWTREFHFHGVAQEIASFNRIKPCQINQEKEKNSVNQEYPWYFLSECRRCVNGVFSSWIFPGGLSYLEYYCAQLHSASGVIFVCSAHLWTSGQLDPKTASSSWHWAFSSGASQYICHKSVRIPGILKIYYVQYHSQLTKLLRAEISYCTMFTKYKIEKIQRWKYCNQNFVKSSLAIAQLLDISSAKYSSLQEVHAVEFCKACSNFVNWLWYCVK